MAAQHLTHLQVDPWAPDPTNPFGVRPLGPELEEIERDFWASYPELELICATAHREGVGRWALLSFVLANTLSWAPPNVMLTSRRGTKGSIWNGGSLNFMSFTVGDSGESKTAVLNTARTLVEPNTSRERIGGAPATDIDLYPVGTGEGLVKNFIQKIKEDDPNGGSAKIDVCVQVTDTCVLEGDEGTSLVNELARSGQKTSGMYASAYSGQMLGVNAGSAESRTKIPAHSYRCIFKVIMQTSILAPLFTEHFIRQGTPQRPLWLPAEDKIPCPVQSATLTTIPVMKWPVQGSAHAQFGMKNEVWPHAPRTPDTAEVIWVDQPPKARAEIAAMDAARPKRDLLEKSLMTPEEREMGMGDAILRHSSLTRLKVTAALAFLCGRAQPTDRDWDLAGVVMRVARGTLAYIWKETETQRKIQAFAAGQERGYTALGTRSVIDENEDSEIEARLKEIIAHLCDPNRGPETRTKLSRLGGKRKTSIFRDVMDLGYATGRLCDADDTSIDHRVFARINGNRYDPHLFTSAPKPEPVKQGSPPPYGPGGNGRHLYVVNPDDIDPADLVDVSPEEVEAAIQQMTS